jgi:hypothetical protein
MIGISRVPERTQPVGEMAADLPIGVDDQDLHGP